MSELPEKLILPIGAAEYERLLGLTWKTNPLYDGVLTEDGNVNINEACRLIARLAQDARHTLSGSIDFPPWAQDSADPVVNIPGEILTWFVRRRRPAAIGGGALTTVREVVPRLRSSVVIRGYEAQIRAQSCDNEAQFNLWAKSSTEVEELVEWFESFVMSNRDVVQHAGVQYIVFFERFIDRRLDQYSIRNRMEHRSSVFLIRTERQYAFRTNLLRDVKVTAEIEK